MASSSDARSDDASNKRVSQPFALVGHVLVNIGTFNIGLAQNLMESKQNTTQTVPNIRRIVAKGFEEANLHLLNLCEVGAHKKGLPAHGYNSGITDGALMQGEYGSRAIQAYMAIWHAVGASQPGGVSLKAVEEFEVFAFASSEICDAQLVLTKYTVTANACVGVGMLFSGQLHIRNPHAQRSPTTCTKQLWFGKPYAS